MHGSYALVPLLAAIAFLGPLAAVLLHRPRSKRNVLLILFAVPAMLWSVADYLLRAGWAPDWNLVLVKAIICLAVLMVVQYHLLLRSHAGRQSAGAMLAYLPLCATIGLTISGRVPRSIEIGPETFDVSYGVWLLPVAAALLACIGHDVYLLLQRRRSSSRPTERNQIAYLLVATAVGSTGILMAFTPGGTEYALSHVGNLTMALILVYAMSVGNLVDIGVALRRVLIGFWVAVSAAVLNVLLLWPASAVLDFELNVRLAVATVAATLVCVVFARYSVPYSLRVLELLMLGRRRESRRRLSRYFSAAAAGSDVDEMGHGLLELLCQSIAAQRAWLLLPTAHNRDYQARCLYTSDGTELPRALTLPEGGRAVALMEREQGCLHEEELRALPEFAMSHSTGIKEADSRAVRIVFPILNDGRLVGVIALGAKEGGEPYTVEDEETVKRSLADAGAVVEQVVRQERMRHQEEDLTVLNDLATVVSASNDMRDTFDGIPQKLEPQVPVDLASVVLVDGKDLYPFTIWAREPFPWRIDQRMPLPGTGTEWVVRERKSLLMPDLTMEGLPVSGQEFAARHLLSVVHLPLILDDRAIGALIIASRRRRAYSGRSVALLERLAAAIVKPIENSQCYAQSRANARIDDLTGLYNRRHFDERLSEETSQYARHGDCFSLAMLDLDAFKMYNDSFGHPAGDVLLRRIAGVITRSIRTGDQAFRYGGDEFAVILPRTGIDEAAAVAERVRKQIEQDMQSASTSVLASIGFASCPANGVTGADLVTMADAALYHAKFQGGNRTGAAADVQSKVGLSPETGLRGTGLAAVYALMALVNARDPSTYAHSHKVRCCAVALARALGSPASVVSRIGMAAILHDLGKIGAGTGRPAGGEVATRDELGELRAHPRLAASIVSGIPNLSECVPAILHHHECYDGAGYPEGLAGENIPLEARILAVADAFANMVTERDGHAALPREEALEELRRYAGTRFDPALVEAFVHAATDSEFAMEIQSSVSPIVFSGDTRGLTGWR